MRKLSSRRLGLPPQEASITPQKVTTHPARHLRMAPTAWLRAGNGLVLARSSTLPLQKSLPSVSEKHQLTRSSSNNMSTASSSMLPSPLLTIQARRSYSKNVLRGTIICSCDGRLR